MILQPGAGPVDGRHYVRTTPETAHWGLLPNRDTVPIAHVAPGDVVTIDTVSHEGVLEEFGHDPVTWFGERGVTRDAVLDDAVDVATHMRRAAGGGPHVVTGPIAVDGAMPGDVLRVEVVGLRLRVPYGVITNRHGFGALPGEYPRAEGPFWVFTEVEGGHGLLPFGGGRRARYPLGPFLGIMGVATDTDAMLSSTPPGPHGGNLDVKRAVVGSTLYLPVQVEGAGFYAGDPHFAQGNGEVCLTAAEGSLRADVRLGVLHGDDATSVLGLLRYPFVETDDHWIPIGLHEDLNEAMRDAVRHAIEFLETRVGMEAPLAYAYLSAAADFEISQVVDGVKGVHCMIRKRDFAD